PYEPTGFSTHHADDLPAASSNAPFTSADALPETPVDDLEDDPWNVAEDDEDDEDDEEDDEDDVGFAEAQTAEGEEPTGAPSAEGEAPTKRRRRRGGRDRKSTRLNSSH